ncbi:MAG: hypothetical protein QOI95_3721 [Acidimicrobiaceae bacterium]
MLEIASATPDDVVLEIGAGTGEIGCHLAARGRYLGTDRSTGMLDVFSARLASSGARHAQLVRCDADAAWPVCGRSASVVFASRVAHLLDVRHLEAEFQRVCRPGGWFLVGRVQRDPDGIKSRLRQQRQNLFSQAGIDVRGGQQVTDAMLDDLAAHHHERLAPRVVASWTVTASADAVLRSWESLSAIGGREVATVTRDGVLRDLRAWAEKELGDLRQTSTSTDRYTISGVRHVAH